MRTQNIVTLIVALLVAGGLIYIGQQISQQSYGGQTFAPNTISVRGEGKASRAPDSMRISLTVSERASTTQEAQTLANTKINQIQSLLERYDIPASDIQTANVSIQEEYDRNEGGRELLGYRARQSLTITIEDADFADLGSKIVDELAQIGGVKVDNTSFALEDKDAAMAEARQKAFENAQEKAKQLAQASDLRLAKPISISDTTTDQRVPYPMGGELMAVSENAADMGGGASFSPGEMEVTVQLEVVFEIK